jgi:hypothetical protein
MLVRHFRDDDESALQQMHEAQKLDYPLPQLSDPNFMVRAVLEDNGRVEMAMLLRRTAETYLLMDPRVGTAKQKMQKILALDIEVGKAAKRQGLSDRHCWISPVMAEHFGAIITRFGWQKSQWPCFFKES